jgi:GNAT superfamily N-acetyltransferase/predicted GNAT family acetyltransferase
VTTILPLGHELAAACAPLTFPAYRHLLALEPGPRHLGVPDQPRIEPLGVVALQGNQIVGLALAERPLEGLGDPELLSVYTLPQFRKAGVGTALVGGIEDTLRGLAAARVQAVYMNRRADTAALERVFVKRGWNGPVLRTVTVRFTPQEAATTAWYGKMRLSADYEIFPWLELRAAERAELRASHAREPWIATGLEPWRHESYAFDPASSVGMRYRGQVVGWVINHPIDAQTLRFTCSFMRADLARRGRILPLYSASIERARAAGFRVCTFVTPVEYGSMIDFVKRHCERWVGFVGETRGVAKPLR